MILPGFWRDHSGSSMAGGQEGSRAERGKTPGRCGWYFSGLGWDGDSEEREGGGNSQGCSWQHGTTSVGRMGERERETARTFWLRKAGRQQSFTEVQTQSTQERMLL